LDIQKEKIHTRNIIADGFRRNDGLYELEASISDCKHYEFHNDYIGKVKPGQFFHNMKIQMVLDASLTIIDIKAETLASPFEMCPKITSNYKKLKGIKIDFGWPRSVRNIVGKTKGCTHITELLLYIGTVAIQTIYGDKQNHVSKKSKFGKGLINSCHAWAESSPVTKKYFPEYWLAASTEDKSANS
jgi:hypothetical protein